MAMPSFPAQQVVGVPTGEPAAFGAVLDDEAVLTRISATTLGRVQQLRILYAVAKRDSALERSGRVLLQLADVLKAESQYQGERRSQRWLTLQIARADSMGREPLAKRFDPATYAKLTRDR